MSALNIGGSQLDTSWFLLLSAVLFVLGSIGVLVRRNPLVILISIELMLNSANLALVAFSRQLLNMEGQLFALMSMTVAAAEAVVGLAILVDIFRVRDAEDIDDLSELRG
ncbi:MAG TPA: NADH-quinone oxidoreductase subunit NuoK [Candidatus Dormibacteraeota bacterium]